MKRIKTKHKVMIILTAVVLICAALITSRIETKTSRLTVAFGAEFLTRPDGYQGLAEHYNFRFASEPKQMMDGLLYKALATGSIDVINAFSTDGRIPAYDLVCLKDDKNFFPPYYAAPLVRQSTLEKYPEIEQALNLLAGKINNKTMQQLNFHADEKGIKAKDIAADFLTKNGLVDSANKNSSTTDGSITVASKEFTEQEILGEILVQLLRAKTGLEVKKKLNLGGTIICFNALKAGDIDLYPEYTGTGLVNILKKDVVSDPDSVMKIVKQQFKKKYELVWLEPFGFNNTYTLTMRNRTAERLELQTISDLADYVNNK